MSGLSSGLTFDISCDFAVNINENKLKINNDFFIARIFNLLASLFLFLCTTFHFSVSETSLIEVLAVSLSPSLQNRKNESSNGF